MVHHPTLQVGSLAKKCLIDGRGGFEVEIPSNHGGLMGEFEEGTGVVNHTAPHVLIHNHLMNSDDFLFSRFYSLYASLLSYVCCKS